MVAIGVDFGTSAIRVATFENGIAVPILSAHQTLLIPSYVAFVEDENDTFEVLIGEDAKKYSALHPESTLFFGKTYIGAHLNHLAMIAEQLILPMRINEEKDISFTVNIGKSKKVTTLPLSKYVEILLEEVRINAECQLQTSIESIVISVPRKFRDDDRFLMQRAAQNSGFSKVFIFDSPTAAVFGALDRGIIRGDLVLIFGFGAAYSYLSLFNIQNGNPEELAYAELDAVLCGNEVDFRLLKHCAAEFRINEKPTSNSLESPKATQRLRLECEKAKIALSISKVTSVSVSAFFCEEDLKLSITREKFDALCDDIWEMLRQQIVTFLENHRINKESINDILFFGAGSRIPKIQQVFKSVLPEVPVNLASLSFCDQAEVSGASIFAAEPLKFHERVNYKTEEVMGTKLSITELSKDEENNGKQGTAVI